MTPSKIKKNFVNPFINVNPFIKTLPLRLRQLLLCSIHAIFLILLCWWWQTINYTLVAEESLVQRSLILKRKLLHPELDTFTPFLFVDVSGTKKLVPRERRTGVEQITDRKKLAIFFDIMSRFPEEKYRYIICDVLFDRSSEDDSLLGSAMGKLQKVITPYTLGEDGLVSSVFSDTKSAYVGYEVSSGLSSSDVLVKYPLVSYPSLKSLPVIIYQNLENKEVTKSMGLVWISGKPYVNDLVIDYRIRLENLKDDIGNKKMIALDELLNLLNANDTLFYHEFLENKIIVIGDYENDIHKTVFGTMAGPLILSNIYLSLYHEDGHITLGIIFYFFSSFLLLSGLLLYPPVWLKKFNVKCGKTLIGFFFGEVVPYTFSVWSIAFLCFLITGFHIDVVLLSLYIIAFSNIKTYWEFARQKHSKRKIILKNE